MLIAPLDDHLVAGLQPLQVPAERVHVLVLVAHRHAPQPLVGDPAGSLHHPLLVGDVEGVRDADGTEDPVEDDEDERALPAGVPRHAHGRGNFAPHLLFALAERLEAGAHGADADMDLRLRGQVLGVDLDRGAGRAQTRLDRLDVAQRVDGGVHHRALGGGLAGGRWPEEEGQREHWGQAGEARRESGDSGHLGTSGC